MPRDPVVVYRPRSPSAAGRFEVHPDFAARFAALGIDSAAGFLDLPGEVVCGHPDRHVVRVEVRGFPAAFYLKRQHAVNRREKWRNWRAGFGWVSRCEREAAVLRGLAAAGLPCPRWAAVGTCGRRSFLLIEEVAGATDLRRVLSDNTLSRAGRAALAARLGRLIGGIHAAGVTTPDLTAKHVLASATGDLTPIDWQSARRVEAVPVGDRVRALAALDASVPEALATPRERLQVLRAALRPARAAGLLRGRFSDIARAIVTEAERRRGRRSVRDQRQPAVTAGEQRLVWVAGEAVCAIPEVVAAWPKPAVASPFYDREPGETAITLPDGRPAWLTRGRSFAPLGRLAAWAAGHPWRSPGVTHGRVLFHLERYGIPAPGLIAFGQRLTGRASADWFALHTLPAEPVPESPGDAVAEQLGRLLRQLHDADCRFAGHLFRAFGVTPWGVCLRDVTAVQIVRRVTDRDRETDLARLLALLAPVAGPAAEAGYFRSRCSQDHQLTVVRNPAAVSQ